MQGGTGHSARADATGWRIDQEAEEWCSSDGSAHRPSWIRSSEAGHIPSVEGDNAIRSNLKWGRGDGSSPPCLPEGSVGRSLSRRKRVCMGQARMAGGRCLLPLLLLLALSHVSEQAPGHTSKKLPQAMYDQVCGTNYTAPVNSTATHGTQLEGGFLFGVLFRPDAATEGPPAIVAPVHQPSPVAYLPGLGRNLHHNLTATFCQTVHDTRNPAKQNNQCYNTLLHLGLFYQLQEYQRISWPADIVLIRNISSRLMSYQQGLGKGPLCLGPALCSPRSYTNFP